MTLAVQDFSPTGDPFLSGIDAFAALVVVLMVAMLGLFAWLLVRNVRILRRAGTSRRGASLEERLQELDDLHRRGRITAAEHATARQRVLTSS